MSSDDKKDTTNAEPPAKKKRVADRQIAKEDYDEDKEVGDNDDGTFRKADDATLQKRRIVKARRPVKAAGGEGESSKPSSNPFANTVLLANKDADANAAAATSGTKVFGSGASFGGFGAAAAKSDDKSTSGFGSSSGGFGSVSGGFKGFATAPKTSGGFGGFGSAAASGSGTTKNLFDTSKAPAFGFGAKKTTTDDAEKKEGGTAEAKSPNASPSKPALALPDHVDLTTGEEKEVKLFECRCKTHKRVEASTEKASEESTTTSAAAPSVPPSSSGFDANTTKSTASGPDAAAGASPNSKGDAKGNAAEVKKIWQELGVGPLKVLEGGPNKFRLVQRYQGKNPGDQPTKVIVNLPFFQESVVCKAGEKYVQLTSFLPSEEGKGCEPTTFSFRMKEESQAKKLAELLESKQKEAKSFFKKNEDGKEETKEEETKAS